jgi:Flp pilus assembly protein TadD
MWRNLDEYGRRAYQAGLHALSQNPAAAAELLLRAVVYAPDRPEYVDAYGRVLGQLGRFREASVVLARAEEFEPRDDRRAARMCAEKLAALQREDASEEFDTH